MSPSAGKLTTDTIGTPGTACLASSALVYSPLYFITSHNCQCHPCAVCPRTTFLRRARTFRSKSCSPPSSLSSLTSWPVSDATRTPPLFLFFVNLQPCSWHRNRVCMVPSLPCRFLHSRVCILRLARWSACLHKPHTHTHAFPPSRRHSRRRVPLLLHLRHAAADRELFAILRILHRVADAVGASGDLHGPCTRVPTRHVRWLPHLLRQHPHRECIAILFSCFTALLCRLSWPLNRKTERSVTACALLPSCFTCRVLAPLSLPGTMSTFRGHRYV